VPEAGKSAAGESEDAARAAVM